MQEDIDPKARKEFEDKKGYAKVRADKPFAEKTLLEKALKAGVYSIAGTAVFAAMIGAGSMTAGVYQRFVTKPMEKKHSDDMSKRLSLEQDMASRIGIKTEEDLLKEGLRIDFLYNGKAPVLKKDVPLDYYSCDFKKGKNRFGLRMSYSNHEGESVVPGGGGCLEEVYSLEHKLCIWPHRYEPICTEGPPCEIPETEGKESCLSVFPKIKENECGKVEVSSSMDYDLSKTAELNGEYAASQSLILHPKKGHTLEDSVAWGHPPVEMNDSCDFIVEGHKVRGLR